ncbi:MAG: MFS transporter [Pseudomonadota bacterium]
MADASINQGLALLADRNVLRMFIAYVVSYSGTAMAPIAIAFGVLELTGSTSDAAVVIAAPTLAATLVLLFGGVVADRTSRHRVIYSAELVAMCAQFGLAALFLSGGATIPTLTAGMLVMGVAMAFHAPAVTGFVIQIVDEDDLQNANALLGIARNSAMIGGAALGGLLVATVGAGWTLLLDAITFGISALLVWGMRPKVQRPPEPSSMFEDLRVGWREFTRHTWLWVIVLQFSLLVAAGEAFFGLVGPAFSRDFMDGAKDWGAIAASFGAGTLLGGLLAIKVRPKHPMRLAVSLIFFWPLSMLAMYLHSPLWVIALAGVMHGTTGQIFGVLWYTSLQKTVPAEMLSRVAAYDHLGSIGLAPLGVLLAGISYEQFGPENTLLGMIAIYIVPTILVLCVRDVRMMTTH